MTAECQLNDRGGIVLARGESKTLSARQMKENYCDFSAEPVPTSEVMGGWTDSFTRAFSVVEDDELLDAICFEIEHDLVEDTRELTAGVVALLEEAELLERIKEPLHVSIEFYLTEDNMVGSYIESNVGNLIDDITDYSDPDLYYEASLNIQGVLKAYSLCYGNSLRYKWESHINYAFEDTDGFKRYVAENFRKYSDMPFSHHDIIIG